MILEQFPDKDQFKKLSRTCNVIPVCTRVLADTDTPVSILQKTRNQATESFLLESVEGGERWARYSFLGLSAFGTIKVFKEQVEVATRNPQSPDGHEEIKTIPHHNDPLNVIRTLIKAYTPAGIKDLPRFWSGITGYMAYEMVSFFENIPVSLPDDTPYARFIIPERMIIFDNIQQTMTLMKICYLSPDSDPDMEFENAGKNLDRLLKELEQPLPPRPRKTGNPVELTPETQPDVYMKNVETIKHHIKEGDIFQAVYSQPFSCETQVDPVQIYRAQRYINPSPYMFFMDFKDMVIAGSSPETMVRLENGTAVLRPIAGTRPRGKTEQEDRKLADELLNDEKERAEHVMLIDLGRNDMGRVAEGGTVQVTDTMVIERYSHVMHLVSNIVCDLKPEYDAFDLFRATFPAGTLSGAPKIRAMEIIARMENRSRNVYGGAAGYISFTGNMDFAITIRTAVMEKGRLTVQSGGGIVYDSDPRTELAECQNKAKSVETALKLASSHS